VDNAFERRCWLCPVITSGLTATLRGEIVQHIKLGERLMSFSGDSAQEWLNSIERRTQQLQGKTKRSQTKLLSQFPSTMVLNWKRNSTNFSTQL